VNDSAPRRLPTTVVALGFVSLFADVASEMIYPLLPVFLAGTLGAGAIALGVIEGVAESTASLLKLVSGAWSDRLKRRKPLLLAGYGVAGAVKPLIGLATSWFMVLGIRFADRIGKGLRTSPRDALIADVTPVDQRGAAFGLRQALDHAGAVTGPLVASALLAIGFSMRQVFIAAVIPAAIVMVVLIAGVKEKERAIASSRSPLRLRQHWHELGGNFRKLLLAILIFTLGNSTDAFLLLRLGDAGIAPAWVAVLWSAHNGVKLVATYLGGRLSDVAGRRPLMIGGWLVYAAVYLAFALFTSHAALIATFLAYGIYFGLTEPVERAWVADLAPPDLRGTAYGCYHLTIGIAALPASLVFGFLWMRLGAGVAFGCGAALAVVALVLLMRVRGSAQRSR